MGESRTSKYRATGAANAVQKAAEQPAYQVPWWKEGWLWLVLVGPVTVVFAGIATAVIAVRGADPLVATDYYQRGAALSKPEAVMPMVPAGVARNHAATDTVPPTKPAPHPKP